MNEKELIVALELGSQTVRAVAGHQQPDGTFKVVRIEQTPVEECIRRGTVYNIDKTVGAIRRVIDNMQDRLQVTIDKVYVGIQGQSLHAESNFIQRNLGARTKVNNALIDELLQANNETTYPGMEILEVIPQEYKVGIDESNDPVGIETETIEGRFLNIVARDNVRSTILRCVRAANLEPIDSFVTPLALAERLVLESERRSGCAIVDMGAETTTVMVFTKNILRHLAVIPLGGKNITKDITTLQMEMDEAEALKLRYGKAITSDNDASASDASMPQGGIIDMPKLQRIIEARCEEILRNVVHQIEMSRVDDKLQAGVIFTGAAANMPGICAAFAKYSAPHDYKLRIAKLLIGSTELPSLGSGLVGGNFNSLFALLTRGEEDCTVQPEPEKEMEQGTINFEETAEEPATQAVSESEQEPEKHQKTKKTSWKQRFDKWWSSIQDQFEEK